MSPEEDQEGEKLAGEIAEEVGETIPTLAEIFNKAPPEHTPILVIGLIICIVAIVLFTRAVNDHRRHVTKHTMQGICTLGIILVFPVYIVLFYSGIVIPKAMAITTFLAETYEAISLVFFVRLLFTYMGGKNKTVAMLKGSHTHAGLNSPPFCCLVCLPHVKFTKKFLFINEALIMQLFFLQFVLGFVDLLIGLDDSHAHPASLIEETYSHYFHALIIVSLVFAIYGLGNIYHSAEEQLKHFQIFKKFIIYKVFVTVAKLEELFVTMVYTKLEKAYHFDISHGAVAGELRVHMWCYLLIMLEGLFLFPWLIKVYSTDDYPSTTQYLPVVASQIEEVEMEAVQLQPSEYVSFPGAVDLDRPDSGSTKEVE